MITRLRPLLGTFVEITVPQLATSAVDDAFAAISEVDQLMSFHSEASDLAKLRRAQAGVAVEISSKTVEVMRIALNLYRQTNGLFDVTVGQELVDSGILPRPPSARASTVCGSSAEIEIIDANHICCHRPQLIDLGGIAKGYAVDQAIAVLQSAGVPAALVNAGGDLRIYGARQWEIWLRDGDGSLREKLMLSNCAIASSANLKTRRRHFFRTYTPHIGHCRKSILYDGRITVETEHCVIADAMTKIAMADHDLACRLLAKFGGRIMVEKKIGSAG